MLGSMSPIQVFVFGIVQGILVLCTVGFFILLGITLSDGSTGGSDGRTARAADVAQPSQDGVAAAAISISEVDKKNDHIRGNENAKISIVEFSDFECPFCGRFHNTMQQVIEKYGDDVNWVYRHFPLESIHANARPAAIASECAAEQGKFWEFTDAVFENQSALSGGFDSIATQVGLNLSKFNTCVNSGKYDEVVTLDSEEAQAAGGRGTPYSILIDQDGNNVPINGAQPFSEVDRLLSELTS